MSNSVSHICVHYSSITSHYFILFHASIYNGYALMGKLIYQRESFNTHVRLLFVHTILKLRPCVRHLTELLPQTFSCFILCHSNPRTKKTTCGNRVKLAQFRNRTQSLKKKKKSMKQNINLTLMFTLIYEKVISECSDCSKCPVF